MSKSKNLKQNLSPIEEAIGERAKDPKAHEKFTKEYQTEPIPQSPSEIADVPSPQEMLSLEELNRQTEERLQNYEPSQEVKTAIAETQIPYVPPKMMIPVSKPDPQPVTETSSLESPPQRIDDSSQKAFEITKNIKKSNEQTLQEVNSGISQKEEIDEYRDALKTVKRDFPCRVEHIIENDDSQKHIERYNKTAEKIGIPKIAVEKAPAEDIELTALRKYILEDGFVVATVAFHIVSLCAQPMTTPSTTTWDFRDRAMIPEMVLALLNQPGYLEGIWPSLRIVMGSNKGNPAWCAGIATTIAFFDVIRTLPAIEELRNEKR